MIAAEAVLTETRETIEALTVFNKLMKWSHALRRQRKVSSSSQGHDSDVRGASSSETA